MSTRYTEDVLNSMIRMHQYIYDIGTRTLDIYQFDGKNAL